MKENKVVEGIVEDVVVDEATEVATEAATKSNGKFKGIASLFCIGAVVGAGAVVGGRIVDFVGNKVVDPIVDKWAERKQRKIDKKNAAKKLISDEDVEFFENEK